MTQNVRLIWDVGALLGEGPIWLPHDKALHFVDIKGGAIHRFEPTTEKRESIAIGGKPSFIVDMGEGKLLVGSEANLLAIENHQSRPVATVSMPAHNRTNDATVDCFGRLWFGTMDDEETLPTGNLYCLDNGAIKLMGCSAIVTNGPAISSDGRTLYHVDSVARKIWRYAIEDSPKLGSAHLFLALEKADGHPDGVVLDSEDCLWVALWDGWGVRRYAPDGRLLMTVNLPCARVTKIAFGGDDLRTAYVTTARVGLTAEELSAQPLAGSLFAFDAPAPGRVTPQAKFTSP